MGFLSGRVTARRFTVGGPRPDPFGEADLDRLRATAGGSGVAAADGSEAGWGGGAHALDADFDLAKNVVGGDALAFDLRIDTDRPPADLVKAYYAVELKALAAGNPSGLPSAKQKREAKEAARERVEHEAKDGRFRKRTRVPVLWDRASGEAWLGATSHAVAGRFETLFAAAFGRDLAAVSAGTRVGADGAAAGCLSAVVPGVTPEEPFWAAGGSPDWLGNEWLLWLWWHGEAEGDTLRLPDGSEAAYMLARELVCDCPAGVSGLDTFRHEGPGRMPEAKRAAVAGKLPRKAGLTVVRHGDQYEFAVQAETLAVTGGRVPGADDDAPAAERPVARVEAVRGLMAAADLLYGAFLAARVGRDWPDTLAAMQRWLAGGEGVA